jgi:hypothetical protein
MRLLPLALMALAKLPLEKLFVRKPDPVKEIEKLEEMFAKDREVGRPTPNPLLESGDEGGSPNTVRTPEKLTGYGVSNEETINYQRRELSKELLLLEKHLQQRCKIMGKACDCCEKHPMAIEALAQEALGMTNDPLYSDVAAWANKVAPITTAAASASGDYEDTYPQLAVEARGLRKRIMGTEEVKALLTPDLSEKVESEVEDIINRAFQQEGGSSNGGEQPIVRS